MNKLLLVWGFALLSAVAPVAVRAETSEALPVPELTPAPLELVSCGPLLQTPLTTVGGSTCAQVRFDIQGVLDTIANCGCGYCSRQFVEQPCRVIQGGYQISGYIKYRCQICPVEN